MNIVKEKKLKMESCFPPLASLSLRGNSGANKTHKNRHSTAGGGTAHQHQNDCGTPNNREFMPKLEVLQDLDLYYIRQIASSLKVNMVFRNLLFLVLFLASVDRKQTALGYDGVMSKYL